MNTALRTVLSSFRDWRETIRDHFADDRPPVLGWSVPFLGCGLQMARSGPRWLHEQYRRLGAPFTLYVMGRRITVALDPAFMHHFYSAGVDEISFDAGLAEFPGIGDLVPLQLSGPEGNNPTLESLRKYLPGRVTHGAAALDAEVRASLRDDLAGGRAELRRLMRRAIMRLTTVLFAGERLSRDPALIDALCAFEEALVAVTSRPFDRRRMRAGFRARDRSTGLLRAELARRRAAPDAAGDYVDLLLALRNAEGRLLTDDVLAIELNNVLFATAANTPAAAAMCLLHILADPALHRRVVAEIDAAAPDPAAVIDAAAQKAMPLLHACYLEALRLYSPALHLRKTMKPMPLGAHTLPAGTLIAFSPYLQHRDTSVYTDPDVFDPERFIAGPRGPGKAPPTSHFIPYGRGVHACLGRNLARQEIMLTIARLLRDYDVQLQPTDDPFAVDWLTAGIAAPAGPRTLLARPRAT